MNTLVVLLGSKINPVCPQSVTAAILHGSSFWILQQKSPLADISLTGLQGSSITCTENSANLKILQFTRVVVIFCFVLFFPHNQNFLLFYLLISAFEINFISTHVFYFLCMCTRRILTAESCRHIPVSVFISRNSFSHRESGSDPSMELGLHDLAISNSSFVTNMVDLWNSILFSLTSGYREFLFAFVCPLPTPLPPFYFRPSFLLLLY